MRQSPKPGKSAAPRLSDGRFVWEEICAYTALMSETTVDANLTGRSEQFAVLYRRAFADYKAIALWNIRQFESPTAEQALLVARHLRIEGNMAARRLAEEIEKAVRADE